MKGCKKLGTETTDGSTWNIPMMEKTLPTSSIWMLLEIKDLKTVVEVKSRKEMVAPM